MLLKWKIKKRFLKTACASSFFNVYYHDARGLRSGEDDGYGTTPNPGSGDNTDGTQRIR